MTADWWVSLLLLAIKKYFNQNFSERIQFPHPGLEEYFISGSRSAHRL